MKSRVSIGADVKSALKVLALVGPEYGVKALTLALEVTEQTVRNWLGGRTTPTERNFTEIRRLVDDRRRILLGRRNITDQRTALELRALDRAAELLETDRERAERAALVERWTASQPAPRIQRADPFALIATAQRPQIEVPF